jgi:DNA-binding CsgD family transcriptional regulator
VNFVEFKPETPDNSCHTMSAPEPIAAPLRLSDVRKVFRLVGEVRELGADPDQWRPHMVRALRELLGAQFVVSSEIHVRKSRREGTFRVIDIGWISDTDGNICKAQDDREQENFEDFWVAPATGATTTEGPEDLIPVKPLLKVHAGRSFILSQSALKHAGAVDQLGVHRAWGDEPFTRAHHRLVRLLHVELGRLWRRDALRRAKDPATALPPRLSQTLDELLQGKSEKEIALRLELSRHTIHNYVKALHQRFGVSSRGELLARAGKEREATFTPQLSLELPKE